MLSCRHMILKQYAQQLSDPELKQLAERTGGMSGRDLRDVCEHTERRWASKVRWWGAAGFWIWYKWHGFRPTTARLLFRLTSKTMTGKTGGTKQAGRHVRREVCGCWWAKGAGARGTGPCKGVAGAGPGVCARARYWLGARGVAMLGPLRVQVGTQEMPRAGGCRNPCVLLPWGT